MNINKNKKIISTGEMSNSKIVRSLKLITQLKIFLFHNFIYFNNYFVISSIFKLIENIIYK